MPVITIDFSYFEELANLPPWIAMAKIFLSGGWIPFLIVLGVGFWKLWVQWRQNLYAPGIQYVLLAIDIPKESEQLPKAVENMFAHLAGTYSKFDRYEKYWVGKIPAVLSFEIVSLEGYLQFLVRTPVRYRDLVEASIYAQYPDAEITEVDDYTGLIPSKYPDAEYDLWGTEFVLSKKSLYPLRTYISFEHTVEPYFMDPMASLLEAMSKLKPGEQLWIQLILVPTDESWKTAGEKEAKKLAGHKIPENKSIVGSVLEFSRIIAGEVVGAVAPGLAGGGEAKKEEFPRAMLLTPGEREVIAAIQMKASKVGFLAKYRVIYSAKKDVFRKGQIISMVKGAMQQYAALNLNGFKSYGKVSPKTDYFWERWKAPTKQINLLGAYKYRNPGRGGPMFILNIEELATLYHFPSKYVKTPLLKKTEAKRAEPPIGIPLSAEEPISAEAISEQPSAGPPNLPIV